MNTRLKMQEGSWELTCSLDLDPCLYCGMNIRLCYRGLQEPHLSWEDSGLTTVLLEGLFSTSLGLHQVLLLSNPSWPWLISWAS